MIKGVTEEEVKGASTSPYIEYERWMLNVEGYIKGIKKEKVSEGEKSKALEKSSQKNNQSKNESKKNNQKNNQTIEKENSKIKKKNKWVL